MLAQTSPVHLTAAPSLSLQPSGAHVVIRRATEREQPTITALVRAERLNPNELDWRRFWVAVDGAVVVGAIQAYRHTDGSQEVRSLVVVPSHRHQGVASRLLDTLLRHTPPDHYLVTGKALASFYMRWGFRRTRVVLAPRCVCKNYLLGQIIGFVMSCINGRRPRRLAIMHRPGFKVESNFESSAPQPY